jgi:hypothetical protein
MVWDRFHEDVRPFSRAHVMHGSFVVLDAESSCLYGWLQTRGSVVRSNVQSSAKSQRKGFIPSVDRHL